MIFEANLHEKYQNNILFFGKNKPFAQMCRLKRHNRNLVTWWQAPFEDLKRFKHGGALASDSFE